MNIKLIKLITIIYTLIISLSYIFYVFADHIRLNNYKNSSFLITTEINMQQIQILRTITIYSELIIIFSFVFSLITAFYFNRYRSKKKYIYRTIYFNLTLMVFMILIGIILSIITIIPILNLLQPLLIPVTVLIILFIYMSLRRILKKKIQSTN